MDRRRLTGTIRVGSRGRVVLPAALRGRMAIEEGDMIRVAVDAAGNLVLTAIPADPFDRLRLAFAGVFDGVDATDYISSLRDEWER